MIILHILSFLQNLINSILFFAVDNGESSTNLHNDLKVLSCINYALVLFAMLSMLSTLSPAIVVPVAGCCSNAI